MEQFSMEHALNMNVESQYSKTKKGITCQALRLICIYSCIPLKITLKTIKQNVHSVYVIKTSFIKTIKDETFK